MPDDTSRILDAPAAPSLFHPGELAVQIRAGVRERAEMAGRHNIRDAMPDQHRQFFAEQPFIVLAGLDAQRQPWATLRVGTPGFVSTPDAQTLRIAGHALPGDPLADAWRAGALLGGLGLQPATRRRNRVNGIVTTIAPDGTLTMHVTQSFGNCPRYIQARTPTFVARDPDASPISLTSQERTTQLRDVDRALLARADTFFIATANITSAVGAARGVDVSHRGGLPGFVRVDDACTLSVPDYNGNRYFNTLGNIESNPRTGLLFIDFDHGDMLYIAADARIIWDDLALADFPGAERLVRCHIREIRRSRGALPFAWSPVKYAPQFASSA